MADKNRMTVTVNAGEHDRDGCPVIVDVDNRKIKNLAGEPAILTDQASGEIIPAQCDRSSDGKSAALSWILDGLKAHQERTYTLSSGSLEGKAGVALIERENTIDVTIDGRSFTTFRYGKDQFRPYFFPVLGPEGRPVTRGEVSEISSDHVHHRSLYVAYGEVNDVDLWGEAKNSGRVVHQSFTETEWGTCSRQNLHAKRLGDQKWRKADVRSTEFPHLQHS